MRHHAAVTDDPITHDRRTHDRRTDDLLTTARSRVRRHAERARYDRATVHAVIDEAYLAHVGFVVDHRPSVLPMTYGRVDDVLYLHGAAGNAMLKAADGADVCVTITLLDGLVLARSAFKHSMNYRSVVLFGTAARVTDEREQRLALDAIVDHSVCGRSVVARPASPSELRATAVLRLAIHEGSVKVRAGGPADDEADLDLAVWAGWVPLRVVAGEPVQVAGQPADGLTPPDAGTLAR
jgi:nitroimidazol reductase NimA-like FMN-containing flavoprotein (pyridoxamine 5'-phosphate oxidase superfamily)